MQDSSLLIPDFRSFSAVKKNTKPCSLSVRISEAYLCRKAFVSLLRAALPWYSSPFKIVCQNSSVFSQRIMIFYHQNLDCLSSESSFVHQNLTLITGVLVYFAVNAIRAMNIPSAKPPTKLKIMTKRRNTISSISSFVTFFRIAQVCSIRSSKPIAHMNDPSTGSGTNLPKIKKNAQKPK